MNFGLSDNDILRITEIFAAHPKVAEVLLFGSRAMGNYKPGSDIDLALIAGDFAFDDLLELEYQLQQLGLLYKIDLQDFKKIKDLDVIDHIHRFGKILYKR